MNANYYNVYSVIRVQLCTWTTNLQIKHCSLVVMKILYVGSHQV
jgi:hypothetical protein